MTQKSRLTEGDTKHPRLSKRKPPRGQLQRGSVSPRGGRPGFVRVLDDRRLLLPDYGGNRMFQSYKNVDEDSKVALLFMIPGVNETARVEGAALVVDVEGFRSLVPAPEDEVLQGLLIGVERAYYHCGRAVRMATLWDESLIGAHRKHPPLGKRPATSRSES